ncbi:MAG: GGDEF domain-containing protein [Myxococcota bacterium]
MGTDDRDDGGTPLIADARVDRPRSTPATIPATLSPDTTLHGIPIPRASGARTGSLVVIAGAAADIGTHVLVGHEVVIGRVASGLTLRDARISRQHARVWREDQVWWVEDLGSTNGSAHNDRPLTSRVPIADGDKIHLGSTVVKFALIDDTEAAYLEQMARLAGTDPLTGLHATHRFDNLLEEAARAARATRTPLAVLMMDLDGVKAINDRHGHRFGAHTIACVGTSLLGVVGSEGEVCRFGGDEFCAYLPGATDDAAWAVGERIRQQVEAWRAELDGIELRVTISVGIAVRVAPASPAELTAAADEALYRAKAAGKNRVSR